MNNQLIISPRRRHERRLKAKKPALLIDPSRTGVFSDDGSVPASVGDTVAQIDVNGKTQAMQTVNAKRPLLKQRGAARYLSFQTDDELDVPLGVASVFEDNQPFTIFATVRLGEMDAALWPRIVGTSGGLGGNQENRTGVELVLKRGSDGSYTLSGERWLNGTGLSSRIDGLNVGEFLNVSFVYDGTELILRCNDREARRTEDRLYVPGVTEKFGIGRDYFSGDVYALTILPKAVSRKELDMLCAWGSGKIALPRFAHELSMGDEVAYPNLWGNGDIEVLPLINSIDVPGISIEARDDDYDRARHIPDIQIHPGIPYTFRVVYGRGTSGRIRCHGYQVGGGVSVKIDGPVGDLSVASTLKGQIMNIVNTTLAPDIYAVEFTVILDNDIGSEPVTFSIGPDRAGETVLLYTTRMMDYGAAQFSNLASYFSRASAKSVIGPNGDLTEIAANAIPYDLSSGKRQLLMEGQRVNHFTYSVLSDAALQSMSQTLGTSVLIDGSGGGVTAEVIAVGEENGIPYLDWKLSGTNVSGGSLFFDIYDGSDVPSSEGDKDTVSAYLKLIESNIAPYSLQIYRHYRDANGNMVSPAGLSLFNSLTNTLERYASTTTAPAGTAKAVNKGVFASVSAGNAVDFTIRVGLPQFEKNSVATSPIKTSGSPATRAPDLLTMTNLSGLEEGFWVVLPAFTLNGVSGAYDRVIQFDDGANGNRQSALFDAGRHTIGINQWTGGAIAAATSRSYTLGDTTKIAMRFGPNKFAVVWEDGTIYEDTDCDYVTPDRMYLAASNAAGSSKPASMSLAGIMLYPPSITPAQMAAHLGGLS